MGKRIIATIALPIEAAVELLKFITAMTEQYEDTEFKLRETEVRGERTVKVQKSTGERPVAPVELPAWQASMEPMPVQEARAESDPQASRRVVYRVVDPTVEVAGVPGVIKSFLIANGPSSAQVVGEKLYRGKKSVESALHMLRVKGCVVSEPVQEERQ